jgi:hypothetical protein
LYNSASSLGMGARSLVVRLPHLFERDSRVLHPELVLFRCEVICEALNTSPHGDAGFAFQRHAYNSSSAARLDYGFTGPGTALYV